MPSIDDEIDALYQLPAGEFIAARNALAKRAGERSAEVRALAKPQAAAWAVNQLYWHRRPVFDALVKASETRRATHVKQLHGESASVAAADARHRAAMDAAREAAAAALRDAGDALSPATLESISRTLEAVPSPEVRGRLVRPVEPAGFSVLASLLGASPGPASRQPADVVVMKRREAPHEARVGEPALTKREQAQAKKAEEAALRAAEAQRREREQLTRDLTEAQRLEQEATDALTVARKAAEVADRRLDALEKEAAEARAALAERRDDAERARKAVNEAAIARVRIERRLREAGK